MYPVEQKSSGYRVLRRCNHRALRGRDILYREATGRMRWRTVARSRDPLPRCTNEPVTSTAARRIDVV